MSFTIELYEEGEWHVSEENHWDSLSDAVRFCENEVGFPWRVLQGTVVVTSGTPPGFRGELPQDIVTWTD